MAGFNNDVVYAKNADFTEVNNLAPAESNGLVTDGQLWIGSTATNAGGTHINVGEITSQDGSITVTYDTPNIDLAVTNPGGTDLHTARFIVSAGGAADGANYTTIASAITAAVTAGGNQTVFIQPGTYTENLTLQPNVNLCAYGPTALTYSTSVIGNVIINGQCSFSSAGKVGINGIVLQTNSNFALSVTGSVASVVVLENCFINCLNNTGIQFSSSSASSVLMLNRCGGDLATTGIAIFAHSGAGVMRIVHSSFSDTAGSTTDNTVSGSGFLFPDWSGWENGTTYSGSSRGLGYFNDLTMSNGQTPVTTQDTADVSYHYSTLAAGAGIAANIGAGSSLGLMNSFINSSNGNPITGSGNLIFTDIVYNSNYGVGSSTNLVPFYSTGGWRFIETKTASNSSDLTFTRGITGQFNSLMIQCYNVVPVTDNVNFRMQVSTDGGSTWLNTGYAARCTITTETGNGGTSLTTAFPLNFDQTGNRLDNTAGEGYQAEIKLLNYSNGGTSRIIGYGGYPRSTGGVYLTLGFGGHGPTGISINAIRFLMDSGNISTGTFSLYLMNS